MPLDFPLIKEAKIQYANLAIFEVTGVTLGGALWILGRKLWRTGTGVKRVGGGLALLAAALLALGWLLLNALVIGSALGLV